jgi:hypothetical protein
VREGVKLAVMQPYFFPYLGYFQLIGAVDAFVLFDDVNFIKAGWINRNYVLGRAGRLRLTLPLAQASQNKCINEIFLADEPERLLKTVRHSYRRAPNFSTVFPLIESVLRQTERNLGRFLETGLRQVSNYLGLRPEWHLSSDLAKDDQLRGQEKILAICALMGATHYVNLPGGRVLYDTDVFKERGIQLSFITPRPVSYRQFDNRFVPDLSMLDVMMFNDQHRCRGLLQEYDLV